MKKKKWNKLIKPLTEKERLLAEVLYGKPGPNSKFVGLLNKIPLFEDPDVESGTMWLINKDSFNFK